MDIQKILKSLHDAVVYHQWWMLAALALIGVCSGLRALAAKHLGKLGAWLNTEHGAIVLVFTTALGAALITALGAGIPVTKDALCAALVTALGATVAYPTAKKLVLGLLGYAPGSNPTRPSPADQPPPTAADIKTEVVAVVVPAPLPPAPGPSEKGATSTNTLMFVILLALLCIVCAAAFAGCTGAQKTAFGGTMKNCEAGSLPQLAQGPLLQIGIALYSAGPNWQAELQQVAPLLVGTVLEGQLDCLVKAWQTALTAKAAPAPSPGPGLKTATLSTSDSLAKTRADTWLATHHSCVMPTGVQEQLRASVECVDKPMLEAVR